MALSFFAMTGFENTANVAEETIDPYKAFPRSLIGGMIVAGIVYVLVSMAAALTVPTDRSPVPTSRCSRWSSRASCPSPTDLMTTIFTVIALVAITNTTLVTLVTQPRILYGMAREDVVPGVFAKIHPTRRSPWVGLLFSGLVVGGLLVTGTLVTQAGGSLDVVERLALVTVVFLLAIYALVIVTCLKLRGQDEDERAFRANTPLLVVGLIGNLAILYYVDLRRPDARCSGAPACSPSAACCSSPEQLFGSSGTAATAPAPREVTGGLTCTSSSPRTDRSSRWPPPSSSSPSPTRPRSPTSRWSR